MRKFIAELAHFLAAASLLAPATHAAEPLRFGHCLRLENFLTPSSILQELRKDHPDLASIGFAYESGTGGEKTIKLEGVFLGRAEPEIIGRVSYKIAGGYFEASSFHVAERFREHNVSDLLRGEMLTHEREVLGFQLSFDTLVEYGSTNKNQFVRALAPKEAGETLDRELGKHGISRPGNFRYAFSEMYSHVYREIEALEAGQNAAALRERILDAFLNGTPTGRSLAKFGFARITLLHVSTHRLFGEYRVALSATVAAGAYSDGDARIRLMKSDYSRWEILPTGMVRTEPTEP